MRENYANNRDRCLASVRRYWAKNKARFNERSKANSKRWREANPEKSAAAVRRWKLAHKDEHNARVFERRRRDLDFRIRSNLSSRLAMAVRKGRGKAASTLELVGCSLAELRDHLQSLFQAGMTWESYGHKGWHIDHIRPCASFDLTDPAQQRVCFHFTNLQPLWAKDNLRKSAKLLTTQELSVSCEK